MTPNEFSAWLQGFMDAAGGTLTQEQTAKVAEKARQVVQVAAPIYPNVYRDPPSVVPPYWGYPIVTCSVKGADDPNIRCFN